MEYIDHVLTKNELAALEKEFPLYTKITADIEGGDFVIGCELHADGEFLLLEKGAQQRDIWGGGINWETRNIDTTAVLNLRPGLGNTSIEILDPVRREAFINTVRAKFVKLWEI